ncbi:MAG: hypothetical protein ACM3NG_00150 [Candidatus Doudnabacteria bacterium]
MIDELKKDDELWGIYTRREGYHPPFLDTTLDFPDHAGFRNGMCHPFQSCGLREDRPIEIVEVPLVVQDGRLSNYMGLDRDSSWYIVKKLIDATEKYHGVITLSWDNTMLSGKNLEFYEKILKFCHENGCS